MKEDWKFVFHVTAVAGPILTRSKSSGLHLCILFYKWFLSVDLGERKSRSLPLMIYVKMNYSGSGNMASQHHTLSFQETNLTKTKQQNV